MCVFPFDLGAEVDESIELGAVEAGVFQNDNEIVVPVDLGAEVDESIELGAVEAGIFQNHNEIVIG
ncbi:hypothetical protein ACWCQZ_47350 [Streptomyces sp. NPDC002285]